MASKDISDLQVMRAYAERDKTGETATAVLVRMTGQPLKVCFRAMERAAARGYLDCGASLGTGWLTEKGRTVLKEATYAVG